jgi:GMP synthase (glutamine-hydrolysing)
MIARPRIRPVWQRPLLVVQTGTPPREVRLRFGDYPAWFRRGLGLRGRQLICVRVDRGERLPSPQQVAAVLITGSDAMVSEHLPWSERTAAWLRGAVAAGVPMLGVCYGHQLLAHALGGVVDDHPRGIELGTIEVMTTAAARRDPLFGSLPTQFLAQATHQQTVRRAPRGAVVLARSEHDRHQALRFAPGVYGVQFHPEFGVRQMRALLRADGTCSAHDLAIRLREVRPSPAARAVLRRFAVLARNRSWPGANSSPRCPPGALSPDRLTRRGRAACVPSAAKIPA